MSDDYDQDAQVHDISWAAIFQMPPEAFSREVAERLYRKEFGDMSPTLPETIDLWIERWGTRTLGLIEYSDGPESGLSWVQMELPRIEKVFQDAPDWDVLGDQVLVFFMLEGNMDAQTTESHLAFVKRIACKAADALQVPWGAAGRMEDFLKAPGTDPREAPAWLSFYGPDDLPDDVEGAVTQRPWGGYMVEHTPPWER